jgi:hypothetical protein
VELSDSLIRKEQRGSKLKGYSSVLLAAAFPKVLSTRGVMVRSATVTMCVVGLLHTFVKAL